MTKVVLLGGSGYIGQHIIKEWQKREKDAEFYIVSRSGKGAVQGIHIHYIQADIRNAQQVKTLLPEKVDYIVNCIGFAFVEKNSSQTLEEKNWEAANLAIELAKTYQVKAQGFIGGSLGSKAFLAVKRAIATSMKATGIKTVVVSPTVVYGGGRNDALAKLIPIFKFFGLFIKNMKPILVTEVADELVSGMIG